MGYRDEAQTQGTSFTSAQKRLEAEEAPVFALATIVNAIPYARSYLVSVSNGPPQRALRLDPLSGSAETGTIDLTTLAPGAVVLCILYSGQCYILGAAPAIPFGDSDNFAADFLCPNFRGGFWDQAHNPALTSGDIGIRNVSCGGPADTLPGDWGVSSPLGPQVLVSQFHAALGAGHTCRVEAHYLDQMLKVFAEAMTVSTAVTDEESINDEGECRRIRGVCKFPHEIMGLLSAGEVFEINEEESQFQHGKSDRVALYEPKLVTQIPFLRWQEHEGYLGDIRRNVVSIPSKSAAEDAVAAFEDEDRYLGVLEEQYGAEGSYRLRSAREIIFRKYVPFPVPEATADPADPDGDSAETYAAPDEEIKDWSWDEDTPAVRGSMFGAYLAHRFNWYGKANYVPHEKDWRWKQEEEVNTETGVEAAVAQQEAIASLKSKYWATRPTAVTLKVDARTGSLTYVQASSTLALMDDGSILLEDTYGAQISLSGGHITMTAPGDINIRPGRDAVTWAPGDIIQRAGEHVDITSSDKDVRIKAQKNVHVLSGNGENTGGILLESRSESSNFDYENKQGEDIVGSGVVVKCPKSAFAVWAGVAHVESLEGPITHIAEAGEGNIYSKSGIVWEHLKDGHFHTFEDEEGVFHRFSAKASELSNSSLLVQGQIISTGTDRSPKKAGLFTSGQVACSQVLHDASTDKVGSAGGLIAERIKEVREDVEEARESVAAAQEAVDTALEDASHPANPDLRSGFGFTLRTDEQYGVEDFTIASSSWQRRLGDQGVVWEESPVKLPLGDAVTYPHPGTKWEDDVLEVPAEDAEKEYIDPATGVSSKRGDNGNSWGEARARVEKKKPSEAYYTLKNVNV